MHMDGWVGILPSKAASGGRKTEVGGVESYLLSTSIMLLLLWSLLR